MAEALDKISVRLRQFPVPDQNQQHNGIAAMEMSGIAYTNAPDGIITLTLY